MMEIVFHHLTIDEGPSHNSVFDVHQASKSGQSTPQFYMKTLEDRGGSWNLDAWSARCARRLNFRADFWGPGLGFRLVMLRH
ncbi:MAG: hypothetical protein P8010_20595 [Desulfosarcinaceae bacterium]|jgi:hypothetical protein